MTTKLVQFDYTINSHRWYGFAEVQKVEGIPPIVEISELYLAGYMDDDPKDLQDVVDYQLILDIMDMIAKGVKNNA